MQAFNSTFFKGGGRASTAGGFQTPDFNFLRKPLFLIFTIQTLKKIKYLLKPKEQQNVKN
jgi:hypothetical protein